MGLRIEIFLYSILVMSFFTMPAFAEENFVEPTVHVETDKLEYEIGEIVTISGLVEAKKMPVVAMRIYDPDGSIVSANQIELEEDSTFSKIISLDSVLYDKKGTYSVTIDYGKIKTETYFDLGTPEIEDTNEIIEEENFDFPEIIVITDKEIYQDGDTLTIVGLVSELKESSALIGIYDPFGFPAGFYFGEIDSNLEFSVNFPVKAGVNFKTEGEYSVVARYGDSEDTVAFQYFEILEENESNQIQNENDLNEIVPDDIIQNDDKTNSKKKETTTNTEKIIKEKNVIRKETKKEIDNSITPPKKSTNLSVEDVELGKILNQINLGCDKSEYGDIVSYYDSMGPALLRLCKYEQAISFYDETLNENPKNIEALNNKGSALTKMGHYEEAINFYDMVIDIDSKNFQALNNKANALTNLENYGTAITLYEKALLLDPNNPIIQKNLKLTIEKLSSLPPPPEEIRKSPSIVEKTEKKSVVLDTNKPELNLFDQISNALSSFFGFLS